MRLAVLLVAFALLFALAPAVAGASTVTGGSLLWFDAAPGEQNDVTVTVDNGRYLVADTGASLTAGPKCDQVDAHHASCDTGPPDFPNQPLRARVNLGDGNDVFHGGDEQDTVDGGNGNDEIHGGAGADRLSGGPGNDLLDGGGGDTHHRFDPAYANAVSGAYPDILDGGPGADLIQGGGGDFDRVDYSSRTEPVSVTLDGVANDGQAGEGDNVMPDVEDVTGGAGDDFLRGDSVSNTLVGGPGNDVIDGGGGYQDGGEGGDGADLLLFHDGGIEGLNGIDGPIPGFKFDDVIRCDAWSNPDNGVDTVTADFTDAGQAGQLSAGDKPCENVIMTSAPQSVPVVGGQISVPVGCSAGPISLSCNGNAVVSLPGAASQASTGRPRAGLLLRR
jgi:Ca2+-binding RTX toxin-like protein